MIVATEENAADIVRLLASRGADVNGTEVRATYTNALRGFDAPESDVSLLHAETLLNGALQVRLSASF